MCFKLLKKNRFTGTPSESTFIKGKTKKLLQEPLAIIFSLTSSSSVRLLFCFVSSLSQKACIPELFYVGNALNPSVRPPGRVFSHPPAPVGSGFRYITQDVDDVMTKGKKTTKYPKIIISTAHHFG